MNACAWYVHGLPWNVQNNYRFIKYILWSAGMTNLRKPVFKGGILYYSFQTVSEKLNGSLYLVLL